MPTSQDIFQRAEVLLGQSTMEMMARKRVIIFGIGGVGSWCAEALIRSGIQHLTIVDFDRVDVTNVNRQLMATCQTIGRIKVDALREHLLTINPEAEITPLQQTFTEETASDFQLDTYDYIIDAIDSLKDKALLIRLACESKGKFYSSMGAALKLDPTRIKIAEFWKVKGDPLARALRNRFKKERTFPKHKFQCVFSDESISRTDHQNGTAAHNSSETKGSLMHITTVFGMMLAGLVIQDIKYNL